MFGTVLIYFCIFWFVGQVMNKHTKFEVSSDTKSRDMENIPKFKKKLRNAGHAPIDLVLHFFGLRALSSIRALNFKSVALPIPEV